MKKLVLIVLAVGLLAAPVMALADNGAPSGSHYNLNLLGKNKCPGDDLVGGNRHTIFVLLKYTDPDPDPDSTVTTPDYFASIDKRNKIFLAPGTDFQVTDGNACDQDGAGFTLPANVATAWEVYVRELGKPGGNGDLRTCAVSAGVDLITGTADDEVVCSTENVVLVRNTGKSTFRNVTQELTTLVVDADGDGNTERVPLFDDDFYRYYWDYDNNGLRLVQLRFYPANQ